MISHHTRNAGDVAESAEEQFEVLRSAGGFVPADVGLMANAPALINTFFSACGYFRGDGTFTPDEQQVLLLSNAVANRSEWAVAFHTMEALAEGVEPAAVDAIRRGVLPRNRRMAALSSFTQSLIELRGKVDEAEVAAFQAAGFTGEQVLEVITAVAISAMSNYVTNIARPPLEDAAVPHSWNARELTGF
ncbi:carboxymuconolactone decarboxylase family protein [Lentzea californiensis]|uniref:carboxymuconolactone decarboxylase family protein n=1 Tax=Lentzea californiensis TaxID=438851 RepID=UPI002165FC3A|nr:carboxymuconolactone decarboxylase family protein [Lentzea californiensis]MCR3754188.1 Alkylhydroperoxidase family enzyme, contains CxxC motif [Lentzea californiensis]